jgi:hypothetical protein
VDFISLLGFISNVGIIQLCEVFFKFLIGIGVLVGLDALDKADTSHTVRDEINSGTSISDVATNEHLTSEQVDHAFFGDDAYVDTALLLEGAAAAYLIGAAASALALEKSNIAKPEDR